MNYPRIYSLSTVGILKHYVHDYIFHPLRTDFIGPNGVGKSVIADLLQLLFIYDTDLIQFGTDAVKNEKRSIYTLPYNVGVAYCFLNVEVSAGQFLVIGIALSAQSGTRITPFVLLKQPELHLGIEELTLTKSEIPFAKDFLIGGTTIPDTKALAALLKDKNIYLKTFRKKEDVRQYYQFLFDKEVLSINLSVESNLKAFARVIQSFSKAKSLNLSPSAASRSLKEFLFENEDKELVTEYEQQQASLEKILREYSRLHIDIETLKQKQQQLTELRELGDTLATVEKDLLITELSQLNHELQTVAAEEKNGREALERLNDRRSQYDAKQEKLPRLERLLTAAVREANEQVDLHVRYEQLIEEISHIDEAINDLEALSPLTPDPDWSNHIRPIDVSVRSVSQIKELVNFANTMLRDFPTFEQIDTAWRQQDEWITLLTNQLTTTQQANTKLISLLENSPEESLIHWLNGQPINLSPEQRSAVLYFASTPVKKPTGYERYLDPQALFDKFEITMDEDNKGFWLKLGSLHEHIANDPLAQSLAFTAADLVDLKQAENKAIAAQLEALQQFKKGQPYDASLFDTTFDPALREYATIDKLKEAVACIKQLDNKVMQLKINRATHRHDLETLLEQVPVAKEEVEPEIFTLKLKTRRQQQQNRKDRLTKYIAELEGLIKTNNATIGTYTEQLGKLAQTAISKNQDFDLKNGAYFNRYHENLTEYYALPLLKTPATLAEETLEAQKNYEVKYRQVAERFDELKNGTNVAVNAELAHKGFSFRVIEENLLGGKIKTTDNIAEALHEANIERLRIADEIKSNMVKVFEGTIKQYKRYKDVIYAINTFFKGRRISDRFFFKIDFHEDKAININLIEDIGQRIRNAAKTGEIPFELGIPLKLIRRSAATWKCVPPLIDHGVPGGLTRYSGAN